MKNLIPAPAMTFKDLKTALDRATPEQLSKPVLWWGEERGGVINFIFSLDEDYGKDNYGYHPLSSYDEEYKEDIIEILPKGTLVLSTDEIMEEPYAKEN